MNFLLADRPLAEARSEILRSLGIHGLQQKSVVVAGRELRLYYSPGEFGRAWEHRDDAGFRLLIGQVAVAPKMDARDRDEWHMGVTGCYSAFECSLGQFSCISDTVCSVPVYFTNAGGHALASSRLDWLLKVLHTPVTVDYSQVMNFLFAGAGTCAGDGSLFQEVKILPATSRLAVRQEGGRWMLNAEAYWRPDFTAQSATAMQDLGDILENGIRQWMAVVPEPVFSITGGYDSRLIVAVASHVARADGRRLRTVTIGDPEATDVKRSALPAATVGSDHSVWMFSDSEYCQLHERLMRPADGLYNLTSGQGRHSNVSQFWLNERIRDAGHDCDFNGCGGQIFKGLDYGDGVSASLPLSLLGAAKDLVPLARARGLFEGPALRSLESLSTHFFDQAFRDCPPGLDPNRRIDWYYLCQQNPRTWGPRHHFNLQTARICFPFYSHAFLAKTTELPPEVKRGAAVHRALIERFSPALSRVPFHSANLPTASPFGIFERLARTVNLRLLGKGSRTFGHFVALRRHVTDHWTSVGRRLALALPSLRHIPENLARHDLLIGGSQDLRLYYLSCFLDGLIENGITINE